MIKVIAFDLVGVLVSEKDIYLDEKEDKLERLFGPNISDLEYIKDASLIYSGDIESKAKEIIDKLYQVKDDMLFKKIKKDYSKIKLVIATNHVSYVKDYIDKYLDINLLDDIIISANINEVKPNSSFYIKLVERLNVKPEEVLFVDDNIANIEGAIDTGLSAIKINKGDNVYEKIKDFLK